MSQSLIHFEEEFKQAILWSDSIGVRIHAGRFQEYYRVLNAGNLSHDNVSGNEFHTALSAIEAGMELVLIYQNLRHIAPNTLRDRLQKFVKGTVLEKDEIPASATHEARNIGF